VTWNGRAANYSWVPTETAPHGSHAYIPTLQNNSWWWGNQTYRDTWVGCRGWLLLPGPLRLPGPRLLRGQAGAWQVCRCRCTAAGLTCPPPSSPPPPRTRLWFRAPSTTH
jgi:hypothetical protein